MDDPGDSQEFVDRKSTIEILIIKLLQGTGIVLK